MWSSGRLSAVELRLTDARSEAFESQLDALSPSPPARLQVILAGELVRYCVVPWRDELSAPAQRQRLAEQCFLEAYGEVARGWNVRQGATRWGAATLACAADKAVLDRLEASARERRHELVSVQPSLMAAYNATRQHIERGWHWFVVVDVAGTLLLLMSPTEPMHVKRLPLPLADLSTALDREWFALGLEVPACPVYLVRIQREPLPLPTAWTVRDLTLPAEAAMWPQAARTAEVSA